MDFKCDDGEEKEDDDDDDHYGNGAASISDTWGCGGETNRVKD